MTVSPELIVLLLLVAFIIIFGVHRLISSISKRVADLQTKLNKLSDEFDKLSDDALANRLRTPDGQLLPRGWKPFSG